MSSFEPLDKFGELFPWLAGAGAVVGGFFAALFGARTARTRLTAEESQEQIQELKGKLHDAQLRQDLEKVVGAMRTALSEQIMELDRRVRDLESHPHHSDSSDPRPPWFR